MAVHLIVREPFGAYAKGDVIEDAVTVAAFRAGHEAAFVTPIAAPDVAAAEAPAPAVQNAPTADELKAEADHLAHEADQLAAEAETHPQGA